MAVRGGSLPQDTTEEDHKKRTLSVVMKLMMSTFRFGPLLTNLANIALQKQSSCFDCSVKKVVVLITRWLLQLHHVLTHRNHNL